ncbi:MAG: hypothetical protein AB7T49_19515 [Oligoflexales bacterium]
MTNLKNFFAAALISGMSAQAFACSYYIDNLQKRNELIAAVASELKVGLETTTKLAIDSYKWWESIPTPMCPDELTFIANVKVEYITIGETSDKCAAYLAVTKKENWKENSDSFSFEKLSEVVCTPL